MSIQYCHICDTHIDTDYQTMEDHEEEHNNSLGFIFGNPIEEIEGIVDELNIQ